MFSTKKITRQPRHIAIHFCQSCRQERVASHIPSFYCQSCRVWIWGDERPEVSPALAQQTTETRVTLINGREMVCGPICAQAETLADLCMNCYCDQLIDDEAA